MPIFLLKGISSPYDLPEDGRCCFIVHIVALVFNVPQTLYECDFGMKLQTDSKAFIRSLNSLNDLDAISSIMPRKNTVGRVISSGADSGVQTRLSVQNDSQDLYIVLFKHAGEFFGQAVSYGFDLSLVALGCYRQCHTRG